MENVIQPAENRSFPVKSGWGENDFVDLALHELDAPFRKFLVLTDRLAEKFSIISKDKDAAIYLERITSCAKEIRMLIDDLYLLSGVEAAETENIPCDMEEVALLAMKQIEELIREKNAAIQIQALPVLCGNKQLFILLFRNLMENALKFSDKNIAPEINITAAKVELPQKTSLKLDENRSYQKIIIADNSIGIDTADMERIFQPFVRLHGKSDFRGHGLGLAICRRIMDVHKGVIYCEAGQQGGTQFIFILPEHDNS